MADLYTLTLHNRSQQPGFALAVFAVLPVHTGQPASESAGADRPGASDVYAPVWLAKPLDHGQQVVFSWTLDFSVGYAELGCEEDKVWSSANDPLPVRWDSNDCQAACNSALLDHPDAVYRLARAENPRPLHGRRTYLDTADGIPPWTPEKGPSVGLALQGGERGDPSSPVPAIVTDSGPNLLHTFDLTPCYHIYAGQDADTGTMIPVDTVARFQQVTFDPGHFTDEWTLNPDNLWAHGPPQTSG